MDSAGGWQVLVSQKYKQLISMQGLYFGDEFFWKFMYFSDNEVDKK